MKKPAAQLIPLLTGALAGFITGSAALKQVSGIKDPVIPGNHSTALIPSRTATAVVFSGKTAATEKLVSAEAFQAMGAQAKLELAAGLASLTPIQREAVLKECAAWPEPASTQMLRMLLSCWAETDSSAAADWAFRHLEGRANDCFEDIAQIWAARNGQGLAVWSHDALTQAKLPYADGIRVRAPRALERYAPVALAEFLELDCNKAFSYNGADFSNSLRTPEAIRAMTAKLAGHVEYISDLEELHRQFAGKSSNPRNMATKNGWNTLFEQTATALHRLSAQECDAWLATFPENARIVARHEIARAESQRADAVSPSTAGPSDP